MTREAAPSSSHECFSQGEEREKWGGNGQTWGTELLLF